jgi:hypothetical protein
VNLLKYLFGRKEKCDACGKAFCVSDKQVQFIPSSMENWWDDKFVFRSCAPCLAKRKVWEEERQAEKRRRFDERSQLLRIWLNDVPLIADLATETLGIEYHTHLRPPLPELLSHEEAAKIFDKALLKEMESKTTNISVRRWSKTGLPDSNRDCLYLEMSYGYLAGGEMYFGSIFKLVDGRYAIVWRPGGSTGAPMQDYA